MIANLITLMSEIFAYRKCRDFREFVKIRDIKWSQKKSFWLIIRENKFQQKFVLSFLCIF